MPLAGRVSAGFTRIPFLVIKLVWNHLQDRPNNMNFYFPTNNRGSPVDFVGCDPYDNGFNNAWPTSVAQWEGWAAGVFNPTTGVVRGLDGFRRYAVSLGLKVTYDEWGATNRAVQDNSGNPAVWVPDGSNNGIYCDQMFRYFTEHAADIEFEVYFNAANPHKIEPADNPGMLPLARAAYQAAWSGTAPPPPNEFYTAVDDPAVSQVEAPATPAVTLDIDVLANDESSSPRTLFSVTAVAPLAQTRLSIANNRLRISYGGLGVRSYQINYHGQLTSNAAVGDDGVANLTITDAPVVPGGNDPFDSATWQTPTITAERFVSPGGSGNNDGLTQANAMSWTQGMNNFLAAGRRIRLLPGDYGDRLISGRSYDQNNPAVIETLAANYAVTIPATWPQTANSETYCAVANRSRFDNLQVTNTIGLIIRGIWAGQTKPVGGFSDSTSRWIMFRNCHWDWRGVTSGNPPSDMIELSGNDANSSVRNFGFYECAGTKDATQGSKTTQPDYWVTNYNLNGVYYTRCVTTGSYNHAISGKEGLGLLKITDTFFRDTGNCASEAGQSMDHTRTPPGGSTVLREFTSRRIEYVGCWFRAGGFSNDNQIAIRVKNVQQTLIDNCTFMNGWGCSIYVNLFSGAGGIVGLERDTQNVLIREQPYAQSIVIQNCSLGNNDLIINCRGGLPVPTGGPTTPPRRLPPSPTALAPVAGTYTAASTSQTTTSPRARKRRTCARATSTSTPTRRSSSRQLELLTPTTSGSRNRRPFCHRNQSMKSALDSSQTPGRSTLSPPQ